MNANKPGKALGRPRQFDVEEGVETAMRLFWEKGYDGVSVSDLASAIGVNPPSFYAAYGNKLNLFRMALERYQATHGRFFAALFETDPPLRETLHAVLQSAADVYTSDETCRGCLVLDGTGNSRDAELRDLVDGLKAGLKSRIRDLADRDGAVRGDVLAEYVLFVLAGMSARARARIPKAEVSQTLRQALVGLDQLFET